MPTPNTPVLVPEYQSEVSLEHAAEFSEKDVRELFGFWDEQIIMLAKQPGQWFICRIGDHDCRRPDNWFVRCVNLLESRFEISHKHRWIGGWEQSLGQNLQEVR